MSEPRLEDELHNLADHLLAPATETGRQAIGHRSRVLRRRRRARNAAAGGILGMLVVVGAVSFREDGGKVETGPANPGSDADVPALTVDLDGWEITEVVEGVDEEPDELPFGMFRYQTFQVFRRPGELAGPTVWLEHTPSSDSVLPQPDETPVDIDGVPGSMRVTGPDTLGIFWNPEGSDSIAHLYAWGLSEEEALLMAKGMRLREEQLSYPPSGEDEFGLRSSYFPDGLLEETILQPRTGPATSRLLVLSRGQERIRIRVDGLGQYGFETNLNVSVDIDGATEEVTVMGRQALLHDTSLGWSLRWRHNAVGNVVITFLVEDESTVHEAIDALRELSDSEWRQLVESYATEATTP